MVLKDYLAGVRYKTAMAEEELERLPVTSVTNDSRQVRKGSEIGRASCRERV